ncbi:ABC transporter ATP-binding protein [Paraburkholderia sp. BCC1886]|uniref:ABC transporter ATP-binding protein n=1 Tax=Paraburkholderia sp. BCC1886 TaxID=2562670 RepID=UPI001182AC6A|nr:oligopeptide/dipeptide ABC transporter ATP-binding protein [Paraburkholderia sp. BCC1886]
MSETGFVHAENLHRTYSVRRGLFGRARALHAVSGVSFEIPKGETFGLVGESGSGKSTIARMLLAAEPATSGQVRIGDLVLGSLDASGEKRLRRTVQPVLQDPYSALSPHLRVAGIVGEPLGAHGLRQGAERDPYIDSILNSVGLASSLRRRYPRELSGGQRQRVAIARALALEPQALVLDEPVSALDVSVQAQILNLLKDLQRERGLSYLLISHDLAVVAYMASRVGVLYLGEMMEQGTRDDVIRRARHPYTQALIASSEAGLDGPVAARGEIPSPLDLPPGCLFEPRCPHASARCRNERPALRPLSATHRIACHFDLPAVDAVSSADASLS